MTHNPYANLNRKDGKLWSKYEEEILEHMLKEGASRKEMADALPGRTLSAVKCHIRYLVTPTAQIAEENRRAKNNRQRLHYRRKTSRNHVIVETVVVPDSVIEDRNLRYMAPRTLTAIICGDPEPNRRRL